MATSDRLTFLAEWKDSFSSMNWKFHLFFYPSDGTLELFDILKHRMFLKRTKCHEVGINDLFVGATLRICSRLICVTDYGDSYTRSKFEFVCQKTCGILKPEVANRKGEIVKCLIENNFKVINMKTVQLNEIEAHEVFRDYEDESVLSSVIDHVISGPIVAFQVLGSDAVTKLLELVGPEDSEKAKADHSDSLRAIYGIDKVRNGIHVSASMECAQRDSAILFNKMPFAFVKNTTCCVIKPHAVKEGKAGNIMNMIEGFGYEITGINMCTLNVEQAEKFYEVYKYVLSEYQDMVQELCCGPCIALEIRPQSEKESISKFREIIGPRDCETAKMVRPNSMRAKFGISKVQNSIHVTDLIEDASREVEYFFRVIG